MSFLSKIIVAGKQLLEINDGTPFVTTSGTSSAYTVTIPEFTDIVDGMKLLVRFHLDNETNATITINSLTAVLLGVSGDEATPIPAGTIKKDSVWLIVKSENRWLLTNYAGDYSQLTEQINAKQDKLISGTNIKTVNNQSLVGSGNVSIDTGVDLTTAQTISGVKTFTSLPIIPTDTPSQNGQAISKKYLDDTLNGFSKYQKQITTNADLNTFVYETSAGWWYAGGSNNIENKPSGVDGFGLQVIKSANTLSSQILYPYSTNKNIITPFFRTQENDNDHTWSEWQQFSSTSQLDLIQSNLQTNIDKKQDKLVSGISIKTINSESLLGEGNIALVSPDDLAIRLNKKLDKEPANQYYYDEFPGIICTSDDVIEVPGSNYKIGDVLRCNTTVNYSHFMIYLVVLGINETGGVTKLGECLKNLSPESLDSSSETPEYAYGSGTGSGLQVNFTVMNLYNTKFANLKSLIIADKGSGYKVNDYIYIEFFTTSESDTHISYTSIAYKITEVDDEGGIVNIEQAYGKNITEGFDLIVFDKTLLEQNTIPVQTTGAGNGCNVILNFDYLTLSSISDELYNLDSYVRGSTVNDYSDQEITGVKTFTSLPKIPTDTPNLDEQVASKKYVDDTKTELSTLINSKQDNISGAATSIVTNNLTANRTLISDGSGKVSVSNITSTELNYLDGVSSNIQTQLNSKQSTLVSGTNIKTINNNSLLGGGNISIDIGMDLSSAQTVTGIKTFNALPISSATPSSANQLTTKSYVDNAIANKTSEPIVCEYFRWGPQLPNGTVLNEGGSYEWNKSIWESISTGSIVQYTSAADGSTQNTVVILSYYTTTGNKSGGGRYWTNTLSYALGTALHSISISFDLSGNYVAGTSFSGGVACFTPETLIDTPNGLTPIKDIKEGDNVYTLDKDNCIQMKPIIKTFNHTVNNLIQFTVGNETFKASETHPFLTKDRGYVTAKFLCVGDILFDKDGKEKCITDIKLLDVDNTTVYEIRPQDNENYFIGNQSIFVYCEAI